MKTGVSDLKELKNRLDGIEQKKLLVIGDIMLDRFAYGTVDRLSPESNAPVLDIRRERSMLGGAGNVSANLQTLGAQVTTLAVIGNDETGEIVAGLLDNTNGLIQSDTRPTTVKTRFLYGDQHLLRADRESREEISSEEETKLLALANKLIPESDIVILSDYNKGVLTSRIISEVITLAQKSGAYVLADPKKDNFRTYQGVSVMTPNRTELQKATGLDTDSEEQIVKAAHKLMRDTGLGKLVVTRSEDGMSVFIEGEAPVHIAQKASHVADVSGAGDTVIATLAACLATGTDLVEAARIACAAAEIIVGQDGTTQISIKELRSALGRQIKINAGRNRTREAGTYTDEAAAKIIENWKAQGLEVGFTNGCFDILHYGHVNYLNCARDKCDRLVLGLNHDQSVRLLKGPERPLHDQSSRAAVVGALGAVDMVVFFGARKEGEDNTPCALIETIRPDIYFKGGDYAIDQLPEAKSMDKIGGRVEIMPLYEGHSTTSTITRMKDTESA